MVLILIAGWLVMMILDKVYAQYMLLQILATDAAICGNQVVEDGEQCDCGFEDDCKESKCCYSASDGENKCKRKPEKQCR